MAVTTAVRTRDNFSKFVDSQAEVKLTAPCFLCLLLSPESSHASSWLDLTRLDCVDSTLIDAPGPGGLVVWRVLDDNPDVLANWDKYSKKQDGDAIRRLIGTIGVSSPLSSLRKAFTSIRDAEEESVRIRNRRLFWRRRLAEECQWGLPHTRGSTRRSHITLQQ